MCISLSGQSNRAVLEAKVQICRDSGLDNYFFQSKVSRVCYAVIKSNCPGEIFNSMRKVRSNGIDGLLPCLNPYLFF